MPIWRPSPLMGALLGDAARYTLARSPADSPLSLDGEELRKQTNDNPVFYVQYAHARIASVLASPDVDAGGLGGDPAR